MAQAGYAETFSNFLDCETSTIIDRLKSFVPDADEGQIRAWRDSIRILKVSIKELLSRSPILAETASVLLEYVIPLEERRVDAIFLLEGGVVVLEFKGKSFASQADVDQAAAYARDLRAYHRACSEVPVHCLLVLTRAAGALPKQGEVQVIGPDRLTRSCEDAMCVGSVVPASAAFLAADSYRPLPSLIKAARELFNCGTLKRIHRAAVATEPTIEKCSAIVHETACRKRRALILICGVPGAGKTLVGLQLAHAKYLDDLAVVRENGEKPTAPAVFLSGNGPLVEVLQYELRAAGGDGKAFVRGVHEYVKTFTRKSSLIPPQHVLIYDEAQRAFDAAQVDLKHKDMPSEFKGLSEPELFVQFAERVPEWCVVVGLIGSGQEIHIGEEAGIGQWMDAIKKAKLSDQWDIYLPDSPDIAPHFETLPRVFCTDKLELLVTIRFHLATQLYEFVSSLLSGDADRAMVISKKLEQHGYNLRMTHNLTLAKQYLHDRYNQNRDARYGMVASSKDKELQNYGVPKGFKSPNEVRLGKFGVWYTEPKGSAGSCTALESVATEFGSQGLELDCCLLAWGTDFIREAGKWTNRHASGYQDKARIVDAMKLRLNAYRVLLTRGRDGCLIFIPPIADKMKETYWYLKQCGFTELKAPGEEGSVTYQYVS
ncbi:DNA/RNA helicase domain-containing protein [Geomonas edaphica]|uniref:DNA/RNA helicase domain-containing protein n=1 Tax=Geomonas edaphica TaxID=2570226 RepID=UPI0010A833E6|nr:DNA/RNA helicase domain-containing protein [Geomonas edaphica]